MPDPVEGTLTKETLVRVAREQSGLDIKESEAEELTKLVNTLQAEARVAYTMARDGDVPTVTFALEEWTND